MGKIQEELQWRFQKLLSDLGKFAVHESRKNITGIYGTVREKLKVSASDPLHGNKKPAMVMVEEMQAKLEKLEDKNNIEQKNQISTERSAQLEHLKEVDDEPSKSSVHELTDKRRIFIRSRL